MTDPTESATLELRRMVDEDPTHAGSPDVGALVRSGRRRLARNRSILGGTALAAAAAVVVPTLLLAGGSDDAATDPANGGVADQPSAPPPTTITPTTINGVECGVLSCIDPENAHVESGDLVGEPLVVGLLPGGGKELVYVINTEGVDFGTGEEGKVDVLKAGYRIDGRLYSTVWALQPGYDGDSPTRFWSNPGRIAARDGSGDHYVVVGYVDGTPDEITWSAPDGGSGAVAGMQAMDGYTIFYLTQPLPEDYVPPGVVKRKDGSVNITNGGDFPPDLTIHTSDGWSCTLEKCGSMG